METQGNEGHEDKLNLEPSVSSTDSELADDKPSVHKIPLKKSNEDNDVDAVAMLLGLSQGDGSDDAAGGASARAGSARNKRTLPGSMHPNLTGKGELRIGPGDDRVRPPKAATKLLPEAKWRHIRLRKVESALEAEDLVVMWAHFKFPEKLSRSKAEGHLNFKWGHYDEKVLRAILEPIASGEALENFLKERYGVSSCKKARTGTSPPPNGNCGSNIVAMHPKEAEIKRGSADGMGTGPSGILQIKAIGHDAVASNPSSGTVMVRDGKQSHDMAGLLYISAGLKDDAQDGEVADAIKPSSPSAVPSSPTAKDNERQPKNADTSGNKDSEIDKQTIGPQGSSGIKQTKIKLSDNSVNDSAVPICHLTAPAIASQQNNLTVDASGAAVKADQQLPEPQNGSSPPVGGINAGMEHVGLLPKADPIDPLHFSGMLPSGPWMEYLAANPLWLNALLATPNPMAPFNLSTTTLPIFSSLSGPATAEGQQGGDGSGANPNGDRPGRPPSYDDMVRWCVDLKRCLCQRHVTLTIEEAVTMVNDATLFCRPPSVDGKAKGKVLVASTLRKRVLGLYKLTWSQVATDSDPGMGEEITDPSVLAAAALKMKRHGMDPLRSLAIKNSSSNKTTFNLETSHLPMARDGSADGGSQGGTAQQEPLADLVRPRTEPDGNAMDRAGLPTTIPMNEMSLMFDPANSLAFQTMLNSFAHGASPAALGLGGEGEAGVCWRLSASFPPTLPPSVRDMILKGTHKFLTSMEVYEVLIHGRKYGLPVSTKPEVHPPPGTMYLFDRSKTSRFRSDGYDFKRRETHAKRKVGDEYKLNCYYVGGPEDGVQRRCYWLLDDQASDLVLVHYLPPGTTVKGANGSEGSDGEEIILETDEKTTVGVGMLDGNAMAMLPIPSLALGNMMNFAPNGGLPPIPGNLMPSSQDLFPGMHSLAGVTSSPGMPPMAGSSPSHEQGGVKASTEGDATGDGKAQLRDRFATVDVSDGDRMFDALCTLHQVSGINKQEQASICRLWMDNVLDDKQKKQLFMYIKANIEDEEAVTDWVKGVIRKNQG